MEYITQFGRVYRNIQVTRHVVNSSYIYQLPLGRIVNYSVDKDGIFIEVAIPQDDLSNLKLPFVPGGGIIRNSPESELR